MSNDYEFAFFFVSLISEILKIESFSLETLETMEFLLIKELCWKTYLMPWI